jgi:cobalt/nickel transport system permease protein
MYIPDGVISGQMAFASGVMSISALSASLVMGARRLQERQIPIIGLVAAFLLVAQTIHIPLGAGVSTHLLGGALVAILLGPWVGFLVVATALLLDASGLGHGGVTALGANIALTGLIEGIGSYLLFCVLVPLLPRTRKGFLIATAITTWTTALAAAVVGSAMITYGGSLGTQRIGPVFIMTVVGVQAVVGILQAVLTTVAVGAVMAARPDLMATRRLLPSPPSADPDPALI